MKTALVELDRDHPGFRDPVYRERRNAIAAAALAWEAGQALPEITYTAEENAVWRTALRELEPLHARYACAEFLEAYPSVGFDGSEGGAIPSFAATNARLTKATGFRLEPVAGLASPREFMSKLADGAFLATQYVRHHSMPLYTPEPDVLHELIGHAALLSHPRFAALNRAFGEATRRAGPERIEGLIRAYWYTLEFGVVGTPGRYRVVGAGLLSSFGELARFEQNAVKRAFDLDVIATTPFEPTDYQDVLFVARDTDELADRLGEWLARAG